LEVSKTRKLSMEEQWAFTDFEKELQKQFRGVPTLAACITYCMGEGVDHRQVVGLTQKLRDLRKTKEFAGFLGMTFWVFVVIGLYWLKSQECEILKKERDELRKKCTELHFRR
jgi:hypothetical protein